MSADNLKKFIKELENNNELREKLKVISTQSEEEIIERLIELAEDAGYKLNNEDFGKALSEKEFDNVAGGMEVSHSGSEHFVNWKNRDDNNLIADLMNKLKFF